MENPIKSIIIANTNGLCLVSASSDHVDSDLVTGFLTALFQVGEEIGESGLECVTFKGERIYYLQRDGLLSIAMVSREIPEVVIRQILEDVTESFLERYGHLLGDWFVKSANYSDFREELEKYLEKPLLDSFVYGFWMNLHAEAVILYDTERERVLFSSLPEELESRRHRAVGGMLFTFANRVSSDFRGGAVDVVVLRGEKKWLVNAVRGRMSLLTVFNREGFHDLTFIADAAKSMLESVVSLLGIENEP